MAKKKSSRVSIEIMDPKLANVDIKPNEAILENAKKNLGEKALLNKPAIIISRLNYPEYVEYNGDVLPVPPRGKLQIADHTKLGKLPSGILVKKLK